MSRLFSLCFSQHTHTLSRARVYTQYILFVSISHSLTHFLSHTHTNTHALSLSVSLSLTHTHTNTHFFHTLTQIHTHSLSLSLSHTHTHKHTHTLSHTGILKKCNMRGERGRMRACVCATVPQTYRQRCVYLECVCLCTQRERERER